MCQQSLHVSLDVGVNLRSVIKWYCHSSPAAAVEDEAYLQSALPIHGATRWTNGMKEASQRRKSRRVQSDVIEPN